MPNRIQLSRRKGWRKPPGAVVVARPHRWGNPYRVGVEARDRAEAVALYRQHLLDRQELVEAAARELSGRDLACWCPLDQPCHADVLLEIGDAVLSVAERAIRRASFRVVEP
jgi:hypothetical protein